MVELDFITFGVPPNEELARRIMMVFDEIDLGPHADEYYYGDVSKSEEAAFNLVRFYCRAWRRKNTRPIIVFFKCSGFQHNVGRALAVREEIEAHVDTSAVCSVGTEILQEYDTFNFHWDKTREHIAAQRALAKQHLKKFYKAVVARDGELCAKCASTEKLQLDHIIPVTFGGLSELDNFQMLCAICNRDKMVGSEDYRLKKTPASHQES